MIVGIKSATISFLSATQNVIAIPAQFGCESYFVSLRSKAKDLPLFALRTFDLIGQPVKNRQHQPVVRFVVRFRWWVIGPLPRLT